MKPKTQSKTETFIIADQEGFTQSLEVYQLPISSSLQKLCTKICEYASEDSSIKSICIKIALSLVPISYHAVPAMFSRMFEENVKSFFPIIQCGKEESYLVFRAGHERRPATFKARALKACTEGGIYKCKRDKVPKSYRARPFIFTKILQQELCQDVSFASNAKSNTMTWTLTNEEK